MEKTLSEQEIVNALNEQYATYVKKLWADWQAENRLISRDVYEVMRPDQREEVHRRMAQWRDYITPLAEAWWKERGYEMIWPDDDAEPAHVRKLETV